MANSINQNPRNKVGRNSGGGRAGLDMIVPSAAESRRGLRPFEVEDAPNWPMRIGMGIGILAVIGGGIIALAMRHERKSTVRGRLERVWR